MTDQTFPTVVEAPQFTLTQQIQTSLNSVRDTKAMIRGKQKLIREELEKDEKYFKKKMQLKKLTKELNVRREELMMDPILDKLEDTIVELKEGLQAQQLTLFGQLDEHISKGNKEVVVDGKSKVIHKLFKIQK